MMSTFRHRPIRAAVEAGLIDYYAHDFAEPGYEKADPDLPILFANWNDRERYNRETDQFELISDIPSRLARLAEKLGYTIEWYDEWCLCSGCGKAIRMYPDNYWWEPSYVVGDAEILCKECAEDD